MSRADFMKNLAELLADVPLTEREEAIRYYNDYFDDAGEENEKSVIASLDTPEQLARTIKAGLTDGENIGEFTEKGFSGYEQKNSNEVLDLNRTKAESGSAGQDRKDGSAQNHQNGHGYNGNQNAYGSQGYNSNQNAYGSQGYNSSQNAYGSQGYNSSQNAYGSQGYNSSQNAYGSQGYSGSQNAYDSQGYSGSQGTYGSQGYNGSQGAYGSQSYNGSQGYSSNQGSYDDQRYDGSQGSYGSRGYNGNQSAYGSRSYNSSQGSYYNQGGAYTKQNKKQMSGGTIATIVILCILASPIIIGVGGGLLGAAIGIFGALFGIVAGAAAAAVSLIVVGICLFVYGVVLMFELPLGGLCLIGGAMICLAIGLVFLWLTVMICGMLIPAIFKAIAKLFRGISNKGGREA